MPHHLVFPPHSLPSCTFIRLSLNRMKLSVCYFFHFYFSSFFLCDFYQTKIRNFSSDNFIFVFLQKHSAWCEGRRGENFGWQSTRILFSSPFFLGHICWNFHSMLAFLQLCNLTRFTVVVFLFLSPSLTRLTKLPSSLCLLFIQHFDVRLETNEIWNSYLWFKWLPVGRHWRD